MSKFANKFWTPYSSVFAIDGKELKGKELIGKGFTVIDKVDKNTYNFEEVGAMYIIELDDGTVIQAYPEEVEVEWQVKNGKEKYPNGFY